MAATERTGAKTGTDKIGTDKTGTEWYLLDQGQPFLRVRADEQRVVREVAQVGVHEWQFRTARDELLPEQWTVSQMVRYFGRNTAAMPVADYEADPQNPALEDEATNGSPSVLWEDSARTLEAAAAMLRALGTTMQHEEITHPAHAVHFLLNVDRVRGDKHLPGHVSTALMTLEDLPGVVHSWQPPPDYEGSAGEYLDDAARLFRSVTGRLQRLTDTAHDDADDDAGDVLI